MRDPWENIPEGEEMATDLAQMKYLEKSWKNYFRVVEDVCGWAAAVSWISIFLPSHLLTLLTTTRSPTTNH